MLIENSDKTQDQIAFEALQLAAESITSDLDLKNVLANLGKQIMRLIGCDAWTISDYDASLNALVTLTEAGPPEWLYFGDGDEIFYLDANPTTKASISERKMVHYTAGDPDLDDEEKKFIAEYGHSSLLMLPMIYRDEVVGVMEFANYGEPIHFTDFEIRICQLLVNQGAIAISHARMFAKQQNQLDQLEELNEAADLANKAKSSFLANMSHEFRTPLNVIIGFAEHLTDIFEERDMSDKEISEPLKNINQAGRHLLGIVGNILDVSQVEAGEVSTDIDVFPVAQLLTDLDRFMRYMAIASGNQLIFSQQHNLGSIHADRQKTIQILMNLVGNAIKFTSEGTIWVRTHLDQEAGQIHFSVQDEGIGIPKEQMHKLFKPFSQVDDQFSGMTKGTGLGLNLSQGYANLMGGEITVESVYGKGSTFTLTLPLDAK
ncbi:MAG: GAF domain-containing sensor histidine kinase [Anaerolineae bacterium]